LKATFEDFIYDDGRTVGMIKLTGTLPILYNRQISFIPDTLTDGSVIGSLTTFL